MVKIKKFVTKNNLKHNLGLQVGKPREKEFTGLKSLEFDTMCYPTMEIVGLDLCNNKEEEVKVKMNFEFGVSKEELLKLLSALKDMDTLWADESFPIRVKMETNIKDFEKFYWKYAKSEKDLPKQKPKTRKDEKRRATKD